MTEQEIQEIVELVLQALATNSKTIEQLTNTLSAGDNDYVELSGGRKISFTKLAELVNAAAIVQATGQSETKVMSQKVVTAKLGECAKLNDERQDIIASSLTADIITLFGKVLSVGVDGSIYIDETKLLAATDIVQTTGTSTTAVMSQKAVSDMVDELEKKEIGLSDDFKIALMDCLMNVAWTNENASQYLSRLKKAMNIENMPVYNEAYVYEPIDNAYYNNGVLTPYNDWTSTPLLECKGATKIEVQYTSTRTVNVGKYGAFYDKDKNVIKVITVGKSYSENMEPDYYDVDGAEYFAMSSRTRAMLEGIESITPIK